jgi:cell division protein FtsA
MPEFAEEILGMPVRVGMPTAIKGITQLVRGPEFATGVGLVRYGAHAICAEALLPGAVVAPLEQRGRGPVVSEPPEPNKSGFWEWIKAAF